MYEKFYGLRTKPFSLLPDPTFLYLSNKHKAALSVLEYSIENQAGFVVLTGEIGSGKTTLIRCLMNNISKDVTIGLINNTHRSFGDLLQWVLLAFGLEHKNKDKAERFDTFINFVIEEYAKGRQTVLIIDEAQNMDISTLEELRMLSNVNADQSQVIQIILVGQPGLRKLLNNPGLEQFVQRISMSHHLRKLGLKETMFYIGHRVRQAGGDPKLFDTIASSAVFKYTSGTPRLINVLCDTTLIYGYGAGKQRVDAKLVEAVIRDKAGLRSAHRLYQHQRP